MPNWNSQPGVDRGITGITKLCLTDFYIYKHAYHNIRNISNGVSVCVDEDKGLLLNLVKYIYANRSDVESLWSISMLRHLHGVITITVILKDGL